jgi:hypothetical protein
MKLLNQFNDFLSDVVNLNSTRVTLLENSVTAIQNLINNSDWEPEIIEFKPQGSWAHKTIIKPLSGNPFDADILVFVKPVDEWEAKDYLNELYDVFRSNETYKNIVRRYSHCVTIEYAGERKIDVAPCIKARVFNNVIEVCNRDTNEFETSKPLEYTDWLIDKNAITGNNNFRKATRLLKYLRDIKTTFTCPSFLLTTLLGMQVYASDRNSNTFSDVPTTLKVLINRFDDWLQFNASIPTVRNPVLYQEIQSDCWDETKYSNFRLQINKYRKWIDEAYDEEDKEESIGKWQRVFGDEFAKQEAVAKARDVSESAVALYRDTTIIEGVSDLVGLVKKIGSLALPSWFSRLPHMQRPKWQVSRTLTLKVNVQANLYSNKNSQSIQQALSLQPLISGYWIKFEARNSMNVPFPDSYKVEWRITNTDKAAENAGALRGDFYHSDIGNSRWEQLSYRGVHLVEAFLISKAEQMLIGKSDPFYVVIE